MERLMKTAGYGIALMAILITGMGLVAASSSSPSMDMVKNFVVEEIKMEGGKDIKFDLLEVVNLGSFEAGTSWRAEVRMKGTYTQHPHPYFKKVYKFNTTREYVFLKDNNGLWKPFVVGMNMLYKEKGSYEVYQKRTQEEIS